MLHSVSKDADGSSSAARRAHRSRGHRDWASPAPALRSGSPDHSGISICMSWAIRRRSRNRACSTTKAFSRCACATRSQPALVSARDKYQSRPKNHGTIPAATNTTEKTPTADVEDGHTDATTTTDAATATNTTAAGHIERVWKPAKKPHTTTGTHNPWTIPKTAPATTDPSNTASTHRAATPKLPESIPDRSTYRP